MDHETKRFIVLRDVVFDELTSYCGSSFVELEVSMLDGGQEEAAAKVQVELPVSPGALSCSTSRVEAFSSERSGSDAPGVSSSKTIASGSGSKGIDTLGASGSGSRQSNAPGASSSMAVASCSGSKGSDAPNMPGIGASSEGAAEVVSRDQTLQRLKRVTNAHQLDIAKET
ncbi:hypothetical protein KSP40_PGU005287 [Platanthera guangdongensis]|uniref:Uncharacterized protein n=1 Tax=Platanthera guangdongensis TaxID=2320717 RepID=A0ABR2MNQ7_9ASPA